MLHSGSEWRWGRSRRWIRQRCLHDLNAQKLRRLKQRKGHCSIRAVSDDEDDKDDDLITPKTFILLSPKYNQHSRTPLLKPVFRFVRFFWKSGKSTRHSHSGLKSKISEKLLFKPWYTSPMHKICSALNKEKDIASFRNLVPMRTIRTIRTITWFFHIADYCAGLLAASNNREFTWNNRVYGNFCCNIFWEILSYTQREFWIMWNRQNCPIHITDKTFSKALVNISTSCYNFHRSMNASQKNLSVMKLVKFLKVP